MPAANAGAQDELTQARTVGEVLAFLIIRVDYIRFGVEMRKMADTVSIQQNIYYYQSKAASYGNEIEQLYQEIARLKEISSVLSGRIQMLDDTQTSHLERVAIIFGLDINENITGTYSDGMRRQLAGSDYQNASDGLQAAVREVDQKIQELKDEIQWRTQQIDNIQGIIANLQYELQSALNA